MTKNFAFDGFTDVKIHLKMCPVEEARKALADHEAQCPGSHLECYGNPAMERARRIWIDQKHHLKTLLDMAIEASRQGWRDKDGNRVNIAPDHSPKPRKPIECAKASTLKPKQARKTAATFISHAKNAIAEMASLDPESKRWSILRMQAHNYVGKAMARAKEDGEDPPDIPEMPPMPKIGRKSISIDEQIKNMAERLARYQSEGQRRNANALKSHVRRLCRESGIELPEVAA